MSAIELQNLTCRFGKKTAVDNVSYQVPTGCVFALLGENGAGKSTTIKTLMGMLRPQAGSATILGLNAFRDQKQIRPRLGYIPEVTVLYDWMTVDEIGWFTAGFYPHGFTEHYTRLCREFELDPQQKIRHLSKGGRAKVSLALAMAHEPDVLILDEPTSGLDTLVRRKFLESMVDVAATGRTVFLSSHQIGEVERVADHIAIMHEGRLMACDSLENLKAVHERWIVTFNSHAPSLPDFHGRVIAHEGQGTRRHQLLVHRPDNEALWKIRDHAGVVDVEVHVPTLEDIFIGYLKADATDNTDIPSSHTSAARLMTPHSREATSEEQP